MEPDTAPNSTSPTNAGTAGEKKSRIAQPPYLQLSDGIRITAQIYEQGGGTADSNLLTLLLRNSVSSSSFTRKLQALRLYRLTSSATPPVSLTEVGLAIVAPKDEYARALNLKGAATGPEPFRRNYERLKGKLLPQDEFLRNSFAHELGLPAVVADAWVDTFKAALETAGLLLVRPDGKIQVLEGPTQSLPEPEEKAPEGNGDPSISAREAKRPIEGTRVAESDGHHTKITLADGRLATIFIPDGLTQRDATRLKGALTGIAAIIDSMVQEEK